jgi:NADPH-dependent 2,4-dienoyl-CoA reductase/sulfur reductase-like enzyme
MITLSGQLLTLGVQYHESQGVKFHLGSQLERIIASESDPKFATGVELTDKDGQKQIIEADFIVVGAGVSPATDFLKQSDGFPQSALRKDGGVLVDECLRVRGLEDVFAIGDIAVYPQNPLGEETRIEHWNVAGNHGRAVGKTISGTPVPFSKIPIFWSGREYPSFRVSFDSIR